MGSKLIAVQLSLSRREFHPDPREDELSLRCVCQAYVNCGCGGAAGAAAQRGAPSTRSCRRCNAAVQRLGEPVAASHQPSDEAQSPNPTMLRHGNRGGMPCRGLLIGDGRAVLCEAECRGLMEYILQAELG